MLFKNSYFTSFDLDVRQISLPKRFTFPFYYQPHLLAAMAAQQLQNHLTTQKKWRYCDLSTVDNSSTLEQETSVGKMFGVLVVKTSEQDIGYLSAYSGQAESLSSNPLFVPAVADIRHNDESYLAEQQLINNINADIQALENDKQFVQLNEELIAVKQHFQTQLVKQQTIMVDSRKSRKQQREQAKNTLSASDYEQLEKKLAGKSIEQKKQLQTLKVYWQEKLIAIESQISVFNSELQRLQKQRRTRSKLLQKKIFAQYRFLNADAEVKDLNTIFAELPEKIPPAGAGDCAAPKLLQYAYQHNLQPLAMAEFWWGAAPKSAIRQHKHYYPSCYSKCQPILGHMLKGLRVDENPLLINPAKGKKLSIVYQDADIVVVNKPSEFLSVPGKNIEDSVYLRIKSQFPHASGPIIVHRLDMSTSGLLVIALNKRAHKALQKQFIVRTVEKRYVALVEGNIVGDSGTIDLPLRLDLDDKPRQLICDRYGKQAITYWHVLERKNTTTRLHLFPKTGRTHQLRVHCAHQLGLNAPIVGDDHYGTVADRLHLHAEYLSFTHPINHAKLEFEVAADF